jgi:hypothetical protein
MRRKPNFRLLLIIQAFLFAGFGLILKNLDDALGDKLLWTGIAVIAFFTFRASFRQIIRKKESI